MAENIPLPEKINPECKRLLLTPVNESANYPFVTLWQGRMQDLIVELRYPYGEMEHPFFPEKVTHFYPYRDLDEYACVILYQKVESV